MHLYMACNEALEHAQVLHALKYPYRLSSYYGMTSDFSEVLALSRDGSEHIMDSGLFSLMFGGAKGTLKTYDEFKAYASKYVETMHKWSWEHAIVECDTQILLGVEETHRLREEVFETCGKDVIYVWHIPEGLDGLRAMALKYKRIALSVPELRIRYKGDTKKALIRLLTIIRETGSPVRVHLLGNTESALVTLPAESGDSSSWIYCESYGIGRMFNGKSVATPSVRSPRWKAWVQACERAYPDAYAQFAKMPTPQRKFDLAACVISYFRLMDRSFEGATP